ncbi:hypothetical protein MesoLj131a_67830 (plasmid) [Mesorhizobium sp. 131-2-1]|nr:hypothetical protein MesoLj131a_67830 [Mesorhizobium sp. 131-2-1]
MFHIPHDWHRGEPGQTNPPDPYSVSPVYGLAHEFFIFLKTLLTSDSLVKRGDEPSCDENAGQAPPNWPFPY